MIRRCTLAALLLWGLNGIAFPADELADSFLAPPKESRPFLFWDWMHDLITREGISNDLKEFEEGGGGGADYVGRRGRCGLQSGVEPGDSGDVLFRPVVRNLGACRPGSRSAGVASNHESGTGWCHSGGPWVTDEDATQHLDFSEKTLHGPVPAVQVIVPDPEVTSVWQRPTPGPGPYSFGMGKLPGVFGRHEYCDCGKGDGPGQRRRLGVVAHGADRRCEIGARGFRFAAGSDCTGRSAVDDSRCCNRRLPGGEAATGGETGDRRTDRPG